MKCLRTFVFVDFLRGYLKWGSILSFNVFIKHCDEYEDRDKLQLANLGAIDIFVTSFSSHH